MAGTQGTQAAELGQHWVTPTLGWSDDHLMRPHILYSAQSSADVTRSPITPKPMKMDGFLRTACVLTTCPHVRNVEI